MRHLLLLVVTLLSIQFAHALFEQAAALHPSGVQALQNAGLHLVNGRQGGNNPLQCYPLGYPKQVLVNYAPTRIAFDGYYVGKGTFFAVGDFNGDGDRTDRLPLFGFDGVLYQFWNSTKSCQVSRLFSRLSAVGSNPPGPVTSGDYDTYLHPQSTDSNWCVQAQQDSFLGDLFSLIQFVLPINGDSVHLGEANNHQNKTTGVVGVHEFFVYDLAADDPRSNLRNAGRVSTSWQLFSQPNAGLSAQVVLASAFDFYKVSPFDPLTDVWPL